MYEQYIKLLTVAIHFFGIGTYLEMSPRTRYSTAQPVFQLLNETNTMTSLSEDVRVKTLADWNALANDREALTRDPDTYTKTLIDQAYAAYRNKLINDDDLCEMLELVDAAYEWAAEERLDN